MDNNITSNEELLELSEDMITSDSIDARNIAGALKGLAIVGLGVLIYKYAVPKIKTALHNHREKKHETIDISDYQDTEDELPES